MLELLNAAIHCPGLERYFLLTVVALLLISNIQLLRRVARLEKLKILKDFLKDVKNKK